MRYDYSIDKIIDQCDLALDDDDKILSSRRTIDRALLSKLKPEDLNSIVDQATVNGLKISRYYRKCLKCNSLFISTGKFNRRCEKCVKNAQGMIK